MKNRRAFLKKMSGIGMGFSALPIGRHVMAAEPTTRLAAPKKIGDICVFSKHLQFLDYEEMAETAAEIGFDGVDLTVRPGGHVLPENAEKDLPRAIRAVHQAGLKTPMITTAITDTEDNTARTILETASGEGVEVYRMGYIHYDFRKGITESLQDKKKAMEELIRLNESYKIIGNYQNHAGTNIGATLWDLWTLFHDYDNTWIGVQYDIRHNVVEGAQSWPIDLQLVSPYIHSLVFKDFKWDVVDGKWRVVNTPIGEGMVDFPKYLEKIKELKTGGPVSVHFEYPLTNQPIENMDKDTARRQVIGAMRKDLTTLRAYLQHADLN